MEGLESKRVLALRVLQILQRYSDSEHLLTHNDIISILEREYGLIVERRSVARAFTALAYSGYEIETTRNGAYLKSRDFADSEIRMLIDGVLSSRYIPEKYSKDLIEKLCRLTSVHFRSHIRHVHSVGDWDKSDNKSFFLNIELIDEAIEKGKQIFFTFNRYGPDKKLHRKAVHRVSPYQLLIHNQRYYLMGLEERWGNMSFYRLDRITNMEILDDTATELRKVPGYENGIDFKVLSTSRPYLFSDRPVTVTFLTDESVIDQIVDWFGRDFKIQKQGDKYRITLRVSEKAMHHWAVQYVNCVEILEPASLRESVIETLKKGLEMYAGRV